MKQIKPMKKTKHVSLIMYHCVKAKILCLSIKGEKYKKKVMK